MKTRKRKQTQKQRHHYFSKSRQMPEKRSHYREYREKGRSHVVVVTLTRSVLKLKSWNEDDHILTLVQLGKYLALLWQLPFFLIGFLFAHVVYFMMSWPSAGIKQSSGNGLRAMECWSSRLLSVLNTGYCWRPVCTTVSPAWCAPTKSADQGSMLLLVACSKGWSILWRSFRAAFSVGIRI